LLDGEPLEEAELAEAWAMLGDELLAEHIAKKPGSRPFGWWAFAAPEPRRQVHDGPEAIGPADWYGCPSLFKGMPPSDMYESETAYLRRLDLLTQDEKRIA
jgi:hypothetical protein